MTDPISPVEDELCDPQHQDPSDDLPDPITGNDDEDDMDPDSDDGEPDTEGED